MNKIRKFDIDATGPSMVTLLHPHFQDEDEKAWRNFRNQQRPQLSKWCNWSWVLVTPNLCSWPLRYFTPHPAKVGGKGEAITTYHFALSPKHRNNVELELGLSVLRHETNGFLSPTFYFGAFTSTEILQRSKNDHPALFPWILQLPTFCHNLVSYLFITHTCTLVKIIIHRPQELCKGCPGSIQPCEYKNQRHLCMAGFFFSKQLSYILIIYNI